MRNIAQLNTLLLKQPFLCQLNLVEVLWLLDQMLRRLLDYCLFILPILNCQVIRFVIFILLTSVFPLVVLYHVHCLNFFLHFFNGIISKSPILTTQFIIYFFLVGRPNNNECYKSMTLFTDICNELGVPLAHEKTIGPSPILTFLGLGN